jgi:hypothetical protein
MALITVEGFYWFCLNFYEHLATRGHPTTTTTITTIIIIIIILFKCKWFFTLWQ